MDEIRDGPTVLNKSQVHGLNSILVSFSTPYTRVVYEANSGCVNDGAEPDLDN